MFRAFSILCVSACVVSTAAQADCKSDIQAMMKAGETAENYREDTETLMGGQVVLHSTQLYRDYSHFLQRVKETGVNWLLLGDQEYTSSDGKTWSPAQKREADWLEKRLEGNAATREAIKDVACETEEIDGVSYRKFSYVQETTDPPVISTVVTWLAPETELPAKRSMKAEMNGQVIETNVTFTWDQQIELPQP
ncbi:hypothetical protein [Roseibium sp.]|uniref:hypothetical protein n=1 Tax=Roseibium sp. TaxID=1936156 RepID=UPI003A96A6B4